MADEKGTVTEAPAKQTRANKTSVDVAPTETDVSPNPYVYLGPALNENIWLPVGIVFNDGIPNYVKYLFDKYPDLEKLFVPISQIVKATTEINTPGRPLWIAYQKTKKITEGRA